MSDSLSLGLLYTALGDELLAWWQYWTAANLARGNGRSDALPEFEEHAREEMDHANKIMLRINELGGQPPNDPGDWKQLANPWKPADTVSVPALIALTANAEREAIRYYSNCVRVLENTNDFTTCDLFKDLLEDEQKHLYDLARLSEEHPDITDVTVQEGV